ncbi:MAG: hypothetical protein K0B00_13780 [Rhodobacteraceae bacterium]|nr:hypothetical protein [Paracoccaceae bacterium]
MTWIILLGRRIRQFAKDRGTDEYCRQRLAGKIGGVLRTLCACLAILLTLLAWEPLAVPGAALEAPNVVLATVQEAVEIGCHHHGGAGQASQTSCGQVAALPQSLPFLVFRAGQVIRRSITSTALPSARLSLRNPPPKYPTLI